MEKFKNKMYNYEVSPPPGVWNEIAAELNKTEAAVIPISKKRNRVLYYALAAAASVAIIIFCVIYFSQASDTQQQVAANSATSANTQKTKSTSPKHNDVAANEGALMTVPAEEKKPSTQKIKEELNVEKPHLPISGPNIKNEQEENNKDAAADNTNNPVPANNNQTQNTIVSTYVTVPGPEGNPVKVNTKVLSLIDSTDRKAPIKSVWNKKIKEWQEIMKGNTVAPTPGNFLDIMGLTKTLKDKK